MSLKIQWMCWSFFPRNTLPTLLIKIYIVLHCFFVSGWSWFFDPLVQLKCLIFWESGVNRLHIYCNTFRVLEPMSFVLSVCMKWSKLPTLRIIQNVSVLEIFSTPSDKTQKTVFTPNLYLIFSINEVVQFLVFLILPMV